MEGSGGKRKKKKERALRAVLGPEPAPLTLRPINEPVLSGFPQLADAAAGSLAEGKLGAAGCHDASLTAVQASTAPPAPGAAPSWMPSASPPPGAAPHSW
jgi:hypothetical protein